MEHLTGTRIRREATPATVNLRRCKLVVIKGSQRGTEFVIAGDRDVSIDALLKVLTYLRSQNVEAANILMRKEPAE